MRTLLLLSLAIPALTADPLCTRDFLLAAANTLLAAQTAGNPSLLGPLSASPVISQNEKPSTLTASILSTPIKADHTRHSLDTTQCATYTEFISAKGAKPYVNGYQLWFTNGTISKVDALTTTTGDWLFNATGTLNWAAKEDWGVIPVEKRDSRAVIKAGADAYLDIFSDKSVVVPWGKPCARLEGGAYTGNGGANDRCDVGIPDNVKLVNRRYVIDETVGAVDVMLTFGSLADSHEFRLEGGKLRFIHTMTECGGKTCRL